VKDWRLHDLRRTMRTLHAQIGTPAHIGERLINHAVSIANRQAEIMMRIASEFGLTPASRSRISTPASSERTLFDIFENNRNETD